MNEARVAPKRVVRRHSAGARGSGAGTLRPARSFSRFLLPRAELSPAEGDVAVVKSDQSVVGNGDTMGVGAAPQTSLSSIDKPDRARSREGNPRERAGTANPRFFNPLEFLDHTESRRTRSASASPLNVDHQRFHNPPIPPGFEALDGETSAPVVLSCCVVSWRRRRRTHLFVAPDQGSRISLDKSGGIR